MNNAQYRHNLPQHNGQIMLTDGGMETTLIFHDGINLPHFAAFDLLRTKQGYEKIKSYFRKYADIAKAQNTGFILETPTWRASSDWGDKLGYSEKALAVVNSQEIELLEEIRREYDTAKTPFVISGNIGPRGDGYNPENCMSADQAEEYHGKQISTFATTSADMVSVLTMSYVEEALGITRAAQSAGMPVAVSFTVETDGRLVTGQPLSEAITQIDEETGNAPSYFMINCAHPAHFSHVLTGDGEWRNRIMGLRTNASQMSHHELDNCEELDAGDPADLADRYKSLMHLLPNLVVLGGCCGTDDRHVGAISHACCHSIAA